MKKITVILLVFLISFSLFSCTDPSEKEEATSAIAETTEEAKEETTDEAETTAKDLSTMEYANRTMYCEDGELEVYTTITNVVINIFTDAARTELYTSVPMLEPLYDLKTVASSMEFRDLDSDGLDDLIIKDKETKEETYVFIWDSGIEQFVYCEGADEFYID